jgi:hypothetical protein
VFSGVAGFSPRIRYPDVLFAVFQNSFRTVQTFQKRGCKKDPEWSKKLEY